jgi:hypothetical protein
VACVTIGSDLQQADEKVGNFKLKGSNPEGRKDGINLAAQPIVVSHYDVHKASFSSNARV